MPENAAHSALSRLVMLRHSNRQQFAAPNRARCVTLDEHESIKNLMTHITHASIDMYKCVILRQITTAVLSTYQ